MSSLPVEEDPSTCDSPGWILLGSMPTGMISVVSDANPMSVLVVFIAVFPLALNFKVITRDASPAISQIGPYP